MVFKDQLIAVSRYLYTTCILKYIKVTLFRYFSKNVVIMKHVRSSHREMLSRNRCSFNPILDFYNKLMEGTKNFCKLLEDWSKGVQFYKAAALQLIYLLKRALLLKKIVMIMLKFYYTGEFATHSESWRSLSELRGVFRTQSHIYDGSFLQM